VGKKRNFLFFQHRTGRAETQEGDGTATFSRRRYVAAASIRCPQYAVQVKLCHGYVGERRL